MNYIDADPKCRQHDPATGYNLWVLMTPETCANVATVPKDKIMDLSNSLANFPYAQENGKWWAVLGNERPSAG